MLDLILFAVVGALFMNGLPHFVAGSAGRIFRSPFGAHSKPQTNIVWGMSNFLAGTIIFTWRASVSGVTTGRAVAMLVGFWLIILMFGTRAKHFFDDRDQLPPKE